MSSQEDNPFESLEGADNWIRVVEGNDVFRTNEIYPRISSWGQGFENGSYIADIGCGQGICSEYLPNSVDYIGVEPSKVLIERAQQRYGLTPNRRFAVGDAYHTGLKDDIADGALSVHVWFHLKDLHNASLEMARILKPGGKLLIITANPGAYDIWRSFYKNAQEQDNYIRGTLDFGGHEIIEDSTFYLHSEEEIVESLSAVGFSDLTLESFPVHRQTAVKIEARKP